MSEPVIIIDISEIQPGKFEELKAAMRSLVEYAALNEPRMIAYQVYLNEDETQVTVLQVHPDPASAEFHMNVAGSMFTPFAGMIRMKEINIYGEPSSDLLEKLQRKARLLGPARVIVNRLSAGFIRRGNPGTPIR